MWQHFNNCEFWVVGAGVFVIYFYPGVYFNYFSPKEEGEGGEGMKDQFWQT